MSTFLVIPTNRPASLQAFLDAWGDRGGWDRVVIVEDAPQRTFDLARFNVKKGTMAIDMPTDCHYSHKEIGEILGDDAWIISQKDSACRCFGFLVAWWAGADRVITLDDDCYPADLQHTRHLTDRGYSVAGNPTFAQRHVEAIYDHRRWVSSVPGMRVRGLPYKNHGSLTDVVANVGLWTGHPDIDSIMSFASMANGTEPRYGLDRRNWIVPHGQFVPVCGMNLAIERKALPLFYFPLQGHGQPYRRFDDIWAGAIAKHCMDALGWRLSVGEPFVEHKRASDPFVNLEKEAPGIGANERFWETMAAVKFDPDFLIERNDQACNAMYEVSIGLQRVHDDGYVIKVGKAIHVWQNLFRQRPKGL